VVDLVADADVDAPDAEPEDGVGASAASGFESVIVRW
jgi:hypothetical protein